MYIHRKMSHAHTHTPHVYIFIHIDTQKRKASGPGYTSYRLSTFSFSNPGGCQVEEVDVEVDEDPTWPEFHHPRMDSVANLRGAYTFTW